MTLDQLGRIVTVRTPPSSVVDAFGGNSPFVTPSDMDGTRIISTTARTLSTSGLTAMKNATIPKNAVMVSYIGSDMGKAATAGSGCVTNQQINSIIIETDDSPLFIYSNLSTRKSEIHGSASGSAQPILNKSAFGRFEIELPPPAEQRAIAHILGSLDDKIELNRRRNQTLEAMDCALFKDWFIDFGLVRPNVGANPVFAPARAGTGACPYVMNRIPAKPVRRSLRLKDYDYAQAGAYFVTICTQDRACLFGDIVDGVMQLNAAGEMVRTAWDELSVHYPGVATDAYTTMPNHVHGIIMLVGVAPRGRPGREESPEIGQARGPAATGDVPGVGQAQGPAATGGVSGVGQARGVASVLSLPEVVHRFKTLTTKRYTMG